MKRVVFLAVLLCLIVGGAFAGGRQQARAADEVWIAIAMTPMTNPFHRTMFRFAEEAIEEARITHPHMRFRFYHSSDNEVQVNNMELILQGVQAGRYQGVLISTFDGVLMAEPAARIRRAGAKTVVVNRELVTDEWDVFVTGDNYQGGVNVARYMGNFLGGRGNVYIVGMQLGTPIAHDRSRGFERVMRDEFPGIRILGTVEGEHNIEAGFNAMQNVLAAHPHIDAVYSHDPFSAMGQEQAIINAGRRDVRLIMACAPDQSVVTHMRANPNTIFRGNFAYPPIMMGDAVRQLVRLLDGVPPCNCPRPPAGTISCCNRPNTVARWQVAPADLMMIENIDQWAHLVPSITGR